MPRSSAAFYYVAVSAIYIGLSVAAAAHPAVEPPADRTDIPGFCTSCHPNPEYEASSHSIALLKKGLTISAVCTDCHPAPLSTPLERKNIPRTCAQCHQGIYDTYIKSVHGKAFLKDNLDVPVCTDCHGEHAIKSAQEKTSSIYPKNIPQTCGKCHAREKLARKYSIAPGRIATYQKTYHGIALRFGKMEVAECASCHGIHDILPPGDPQSMVNLKNIPKTCGHCHPGAGKNFARGKIHLDPLGAATGIIWLINTLYRVLIVAMISGFLLMIALDLYGRFRKK